MSHVVVARLDNLGDVLLAGPAVRAIAAGGHRVTFVAGPGGRDAAALLPGVDDVLTFDAPWVGFTPPATDRAAVDAFVHRVAALHVDEAVILTSFHQSPLPLALLLRLAGVPRVAATCVDHPGSLLDVRHPVLDGAHEVEQALSVVAALDHHLPAGDDAALALRRPLPPVPVGGPYVVVHPGASVPARGIPVEAAAGLVDRLVDRGTTVVVTGRAEERLLAAAVTGRRRGGVVDLTGHLDLAQLAAVLDAALVVVCGNTGPAHLAAAVGTPVVTVFAPVVAAERWLPWGVPVVLLGDQHVPCAGCRARSCPIPGQPCLADVSADALLAAVDQLAPRREAMPA